MENIKKIGGLSPTLIFILLLTLIPYSSAQSVVVAEISGDIDAGTVSYIGRVIDEANRGGVADLIVIKINSNGGLWKPTKDVVEKIQSSKVPVACFSSERFGGAFSAAAYVLMSCDFAAVSPESFIGYASPMPDDNRSLEYMAEYMGFLAEKNNRSVKVAKELVYSNSYFNGVDALKAGLIDYTPNNTAELVSEFFSSQVRVKYFDPSILDTVLGLFSNPQLSAFFLLLGCLAGIYAFKAKEIKAFALMSASFILALYGIQHTLFSVFSLVLLFLGVCLIAVEMINTRPSVFGIAGGIASCMGVLTIAAEPFYHVGGRTFILVFILVFAVVVPSILLANRFGRMRLERRHSEAESLVGKKGRVIEELKRNGFVKVDGRIWPAYSYVEESIPVDEVIEVLRLEGGVLAVVREKGPKTRGHGSHSSHGGHGGHGGEEHGGGHSHGSHSGDQGHGHGSHSVSDEHDSHKNAHHGGGHH